MSIPTKPEILQAFRELGDQAYTKSLTSTNDAVHYAKLILLSNRVQEFTASDVVSVAKIILELQREYADDTH